MGLAIVQDAEWTWSTAPSLRLPATKQTRTSVIMSWRLQKTLEMHRNQA